MLKHILIASIAAAAFGAIPVASSAQQRAIIVAQAPPPPRAERMPAPRRGMEWAPGHWAWRHGQYVWVDGHWMRERQGMHWVPEQWAQRRNGRWELMAGHWERGARGTRAMGGPGMGDRDRDGIANRYDRDRDNDGVPNRYDARPNNPYRR
jgi:hypothetical protein